MKNIFPLLVLILLAACHPQTKAKTSDEAKQVLAPIYFDVDQSDLRNEKTVEQNARWLLSNKDKVVVLEGHCDERGDRQYNIWLGDRRARSVMAALMARGVSENQLIIVSYGKDKPLVRKANGWDQNRRVEFVVR